MKLMLVIMALLSTVGSVTLAEDLTVLTETADGMAPGSSLRST